MTGGRDASGRGGGLGHQESQQSPVPEGSAQKTGMPPAIAMVDPVW